MGIIDSNHYIWYGLFNASSHSFPNVNCYISQNIVEVLAWVSRWITEPYCVYLGKTAVGMGYVWIIISHDRGYNFISMALTFINTFSEYFWTAPELLRTPIIDRHVNGTKAGDVFSFAVVLHEILCRCTPYSDSEKSPKGKCHIRARWWWRRRRWRRRWWRVKWPDGVVNAFEHFIDA